MRLSPANDEDLEFGRLVHHAAYQKMVIREFGEWDDSVADRFFEDTWNHLPHCIIWTDLGERCGYCAIERLPNLLYLREIAILPDYQNQGIGSKLIQSLISECDEASIPMRLNVMKSNERAAKLYDRFGFHRYGENEHHFLLERRCEPGCED